MTAPTPQQPSDEEPTEQNTSIWTRQLPSKQRRTLWIIGLAIGVGYVLYGLYGVIFGG